MNHFSKPARKADELLILLKERGLIIEGRQELEVKEYLRSIGYFRLSGYFGPLQSEKDVFKEGTMFADIIRLYTFDSELRSLTFEALEKVEVLLRTQMTDVYSINYNSFWYTNKDLFIDKKEIIEITKCEIEDGEVTERTKQVETLIFNNLSKEIQKSIVKVEQSEFMSRFRQKYSPDSPIPSWMIMESISFGKLSRLFSLLKASEEKRYIAQYFGAISHDYLVSWLHAFVVLRNISAHHSRLWNRKIGKDIKMPTRDKHRFLTNFNEENIRRYYGVSSCLLRIFQHADAQYMNSFKVKLHDLVTRYEIDVTAMGFPSTYREDEIWKIEG